MNTISKKITHWSIALATLFLFRSAPAQTGTDTCQAQLNALKGVLIFDPGFDEFYGGTRVLYHWYPVAGTDFFIRTDHWDGDALFVEGPLYLGPYDLVMDDSQAVPASAIPACLDFTPRILSIAKSSTGNCALTFAGGPNRVYQVQAATNLASPVFWTTVTNNQDGAANFTSDWRGHWFHTDLNATHFSARFYRALLEKSQVNYTVSGNIAYVTDSPHAVGDVVLDSTYAGHPVVSIGNYALAGSALTSVMIPESITNIGAGALSGCAGLTNIAVGASNPALSTVGGVLFNKTQANLLQFPAGRGGMYVIPNTVTNIAPYAFWYCQRLTNLTMGSGVVGVGDYAFGVCGVTAVTIPDSVKRIGKGAFMSCSMSSMVLGNGVTNMGNYAFSSCGNLTNVTVGGGAASIGNEAFWDCESLRSVTIGNGVTSIGVDAFETCVSLTRVTIPGSVTSLRDFAFNGCTKLTSFKFLGNAPALGSSAFYRVATSALVYYSAATSGWGSTYGGLPTMPLPVPAPGPLVPPSGQ